MFWLFEFSVLLVCDHNLLYIHEIYFCIHAKGIFMFLWLLEYGTMELLFSMWMHCNTELLYYISHFLFSCWSIHLMFYFNFLFSSLSTWRNCESCENIYIFYDCISLSVFFIFCWWLGVPCCLIYFSLNSSIYNPGVQAYASFMKGSLLFEQDQNWDTALRNFKSARCISSSIKYKFFYPDYKIS